jgi:hypothetical protein
MRRILAAGLLALLPAGLLSVPASAQAPGAVSAAHTAAVKPKKQPKLGPAGFGKVRLGMTAKQAKRTGQVVLKFSANGGSCSGWDLKAHRTPKESVGLFLSKKRGVAVIFAEKGMKTPRGIGLGSTKKQVRTAYPHYHSVEYGYFIAVPGNKKAIYMVGFAKNGRVAEMSLALRTQDCVQ